MPDKFPDVLSETEARLAGRPARAPRHDRESAAFLAIADEIAERPGNALLTLCQYAQDLCEAGSAGVSLFATSGAEAELYWPAIVGGWEPYVGGSVARRTSPSGLVAERDAILHFDDMHARFPVCATRSPAIHELLIAPFHHAGSVAGTLWVIAHDPQRKFDREDRRVLTGLSRCAAAVHAARLGDQSVREAADRLALATSSSQVLGLWDWDVPRDLVTSDSRFAELYGVSPERARRGASIAEFFKSMHPDDLPRVAAAIRKALSTAERFNEEYRLIQPDGSVRWVMAEGQAALGPDGQPERFPGISFDITARREVEEQLRAENDRLEKQIAELSARDGKS